jgi:site-specific DNA-methyltransferase (adenine-specific)
MSEKRTLGSLELNRIYQMDCIEGMKLIPDKSIDIIITDPPYGIDLTPQRSGSKFKGEKILNDDNLEWLPLIVKEFKRILKHNSVAYVFCNWQKYDVFKQEFEKEFTIKNCLVWDKDWFGMGNNWRPNHEFILVITNGKFKTKSNNKSNILKFRRVAPQKLTHSCEKPVPLIEELIKESCEDGTVVLDCYLGSGSTAVAALRTNRNFIGFEIEPEYVRIANQRIEHVRDELVERKLNERTDAE